MEDSRQICEHCDHFWPEERRCTLTGDERGPGDPACWYFVDWRDDGGSGSEKG